jgi:hypothetical protein
MPTYVTVVHDVANMIWYALAVYVFGELEEGEKFAFVLGPKNSLGSPVNMSII